MLLKKGRSWSCNLKYGLAKEHEICHAVFDSTNHVSSDMSNSFWQLKFDFKQYLIVSFFISKTHTFVACQKEFQKNFYGHDVQCRAFVTVLSYK